MTKSIETAIVVILLALCMPFLAAWFIKLIFGHLVLAFLGGWLFLFLGAIGLETIYPEEDKEE